MSRLVLAAGIAAALGALAPQDGAIRANGGEMQMTADDTAARLAGTWTVTEVTGTTMAPGLVPTLIFEPERLAGFAGCNNFGAALTVQDGGALALSPPVATRRACGPNAMATEAAILRAVGRINAVSFDGEDRITLTAFGRPMLRAERQQIDR